MIKILIIITLIAILTLIYFICYYKIIEIKNKLTFTEKNIDESIKKKCELINKINNETEKKLDNKNYLKDYINLEKKNLTNIELDIKLDEGLKLIKELKNDIPEIKTKEFNKFFNEIKKNDEIL